MRTDDPERPWSALLGLQRAVHATLQALAAELADLGLTASEINVLGNLADGRSRTVNELGADVGSRPTTLTSVLDRLERRGLLTRTGHPQDRRKVVLQLTPTGRRVAERVRAAMADLEARALGDLDEGARQALRAGLERLVEVSG